MNPQDTPSSIGQVARLTFTPTMDGKGSLIVSAKSEGTGSSKIEVPVQKMEGSELSIAFNIRFLRDVLEAVKSKDVLIEANANNTPAIIRPLNEEDYQYILMPMYQS